MESACGLQKWLVEKLALWVMFPVIKPRGIHQRWNRPLPWLGAVLVATAVGCPAASICFVPFSAGESGRRAWAYELGVAVITSGNIEDLSPFSAPVRRADGPAGGEIYTFTASRRLGEFEWKLGNRTFRPRLEIPFTLEVVDENSRSPFLDFNASLVVRWVDFPWNEYVKTTFATGVGLSYSQKVYLVDVLRHPDQSRSKLKFNWPIQMTFAHPDHDEHQLLIFVAHQSGGHVFDDGGVNSVGVGYRFDF